MNLPEVLPNESLNDYVKRLVTNKIIKATEISSAISKYKSN